MSVIIDLFSGSGSATGIWENMGHEVWRYDIVAPKPGPDTIPLDLSNLSSCDAIINHHKNIEKNHVLLIWASPPCIQYSNANRLRNQKTGLINGELPDLTLWKNALYIIQELKPEYYIIENVVGAQKIWGAIPPKFWGLSFMGRLS